ncbi:MAG TPA: hypothetical protein ACFCUY_12110 [Xenococcaceae cyanobacterium]|jgi:hypothetical protein
MGNAIGFKIDRGKITSNSANSAKNTRKIFINASELIVTAKN